MRPSPVAHLAASIIYLSSLLKAESRPIDRYIDYFGGDRRLGGGPRTPAVPPGEPLMAPLASNDAEVRHP